MGRSVSTPTEAIAVAYQEFDNEDEDMTEMNWGDFKDDLRARIEKMWPSTYPVDKWFHREDHAIMRNDHAYFGISEYCGLVAIWLLPRDEQETDCMDEFHTHWCEQIKKRFLAEFGELVRMGTMSNGVSVYEKIDKGQKRVSTFNG